MQCVRRNQALEVEPKQTVELLQASMLNKKNCCPWEEIRDCKEIKKEGKRIAVLAKRSRSIKRSRIAERSRITKQKGIAALLKKSRIAKRLTIAKNHRESGL